MQNNTELTFYDFMYGKYLLKDLYDIDIHEDDYVEKAYNIFREIGNIAVLTHLFTAKVDEKCKIELPCNAEFIEFVAFDAHCEFEGFIVNDNFSYNNTSYLPSLKTSSTLPESFIHTDLHPKGNFVEYSLIIENSRKYLLFKPENLGETIQIAYRGMIVDESGNPRLTRKEAKAICDKIAYQVITKRLFMGDPAAGNLLNFIKSEAERSMVSAKIPEYLSQNFLDQLLAAKTSSNRKTFNISFKTLK